MKPQPSIEDIAGESLPATVRELVGHIGMAATLKLVDAFGGLTLPVPKGHETRGVIRRETLIEVVGVAATDMLIRVYGGESIYVASCKAAARRVRDRMIVRRYNAGDGVPELARAYNLSDRQIQTILKTTDLGTAPQSTLF